MSAAAPPREWFPTMKLRLQHIAKPVIGEEYLVMREHRLSGYVPDWPHRLQQLWVDGAGGEDWRDVPTVDA